MLQRYAKELLIPADGEQARSCGRLRLEVVVVPRPRLDLGQRILRQLEAMSDRLPIDLVDVEAVFDNLGQLRREGIVVYGRWERRCQPP